MSLTTGGDARSSSSRYRNRLSGTVRVTIPGRTNSSAPTTPTPASVREDTRSSARSPSVVPVRSATSAPPSPNHTPTQPPVSALVAMQLSSAASLGTSVHKPIRRLTRNQLESARKEFKRRVDLGEEGVRVVVAKDVPRGVWERSSISFSGCKIAVESRGDHQLVDIVLEEVVGHPHGAAVSEIIRQIGNFARNSPQEFLFAESGDFTFLRADGTEVTRDPDAGLSLSRQFFGGMGVPNLMVEVVVRNESLPAAQRKCREYFATTTALRNVLLLRFFEMRNHNRTAAGVAILYRRDGNRVVVADVVSFGSSHLHGSSLSDVEEIDEGYRGNGGEIIRNLSGAANVGAQVRIASEDLYILAPDTIPMNERQDLVIDLFSVFRAYMKCTLS